MTTTAHRPTIAVTRHAIAAGHYLASTAGFDILQAGGNAIDAGVAAGIALGVLQSDLVNCAGVAPIMIYLAEKQEVVTIAGLGTWPKALDPDLFMREHGGKIPIGVLRTVVPAAPDAWITALRRYGTMSFGDVAAAAIRLARDGFPMYPLMATSLKNQAERHSQWPSSAAVYLPNGRPPEAGEVFYQKDLAASLQYMADEEKAAAGRGRDAGLEAARDAFYRGDIARKFVAFHKEQGGLLSAEDLANYHSPVGPPERRRFGDLEVFTCGAWCQGPVLLQTLALLEGTDVAGPRPQQRRLRASPDRGAEIGLRRPRGLLHRPGDGQRAAADPDFVGIRRRAAQADRPRKRRGRRCRRRARSAPAGRCCRPAPATRSPSPTPPMSAPPTAGAICSRRRRATAPTARRSCRAPGSSRRTAARSRAPTRSIRPGSRPASGRA
jgi:gamma-glutamyltranspeptidase